METYPAYQASYILTPLLEAVELIHHLPVDQAKIARIQRKMHLAHVIQHPIKHLRGKQLEETLTLAGLADAIHHIGVLLRVQRQQIRDQLRRILHIGIDNHGQIRVAMIDTRRHRGLMSEIAGKMNHPYIRIVRRDLVQQIPGSVLASIVNINYLRRIGQPLQDCLRAPIRLPDHGLLVIARNNHR